jgi:hypothetical protein
MSDGSDPRSPHDDSTPHSAPTQTPEETRERPDGNEPPPKVKIGQEAPESR